MFSLPKPKRVVKVPLVTVCGSFNRHLREVQLTVEELFDLGAQVLSPFKPVAWKELTKEFLLLEGDRRYRDMSARTIEDGHLRCIKQSDFVVLVCPDGNIGCAAAFETGFAYSGGVPVYTRDTLPIKFAAITHKVLQLNIAVDNHRCEFTDIEPGP